MRHSRKPSMAVFYLSSTRDLSEPGLLEVVPPHDHCSKQSCIFWPSLSAISRKENPPSRSLITRPRSNSSKKKVNGISNTRSSINAELFDDEISIEILETILRNYVGGSIFIKGSGLGSLVFNVTGSWLECHGFEPSTAKDPPCRGRRYGGGAWKEGCQLSCHPRHLTDG
ncbi:hypothetical protein TNCV_2127251 [Trichonephila clavipes]|nr:hypothetical protein TNCV_2127251 [Trichonephila clavipes]